MTNLKSDRLLGSKSDWGKYFVAGEFFTAVEKGQFHQKVYFHYLGARLLDELYGGGGGAAILPGAMMQLTALHNGTSNLPELPFTAPDDSDVFGRSTSQAMLKGVYHGIRGAVQRLVEQYATQYGAFPQVIATGGDAETLFSSDELIDDIVVELGILGIAAAARHALATDEADRPDGRD